MRARNTTTRRRQHCVCVSILWCVCDTASWYTHGQENTVCGTPFRLDDDQMELAANARHARVWRGGARTGRHDGLASRPLRNVEPALRARTSAKLSRWRHSSSSDLHVSGRRGVRVGRSVAAFKQDLVCERERASLGVVVVVVVVVVYPHVLLLFVAGSNIGLSRAPLSPSDSAPLDFTLGHTRGCRTSYVCRLSSSNPHPSSLARLAVKHPVCRLAWTRPWLRCQNHVHAKVC
jgi:hypothetical protein